MNNSYNKKVFVGMSGGTDSSAAAAILLEQGYEVGGFTMLLTDDSEAEAACSKAKQVCDYLGIRHEAIDFREAFSRLIVNYFTVEYACGHTPNPCVICNRELKFGLAVDYADSKGGVLATGHYVRNEGGIIRRGIDARKDQSYFLCMAKGEALRSAIFPLGTYEKPYIREYVRSHGLPIDTDKESQDICFLKDGTRDFLRANMPQLFVPGNIIDKNGTVLGRHGGCIGYTIGQRKGLGFAGGAPLYVTAIDVANSTIVLGEERDLFRKQFRVRNFNRIDGRATELAVQIRYSGKTVPVTRLEENSDYTVVETAEPVKSIAPGQFAAFYHADELIAGGTLI